MKTDASAVLSLLVEKLVPAIVGMAAGFIGVFALLFAFYQMASINFRFLSAAGAVFLVSLSVGGLLLWLAGKLITGLVRR